MKDSTQIEPSKSPPSQAVSPVAHRLERAHFWRLLLCSVIWAAVSFGCATVTYVTSVVPTTKGLGALVDVQLEYDPAVFEALQESYPGVATGVAATEAQNGWAVKEGDSGRILRLRHQFDTLAELPTLPSYFAGKEGDVKSSLIQSTGIVTNEIDADEVEYVYTATIYIEPSEDDTKLPEEQADDPFSMQNILKDYPKLQAAIDQAGPAKVVIQATLPGTISEATLDGAKAGDIADNQVRWNFSQDAPGTYQLRAVSRGPSDAAIEETVGDLFDSDERLKSFETLIGKDNSIAQYAKSLTVSQVNFMRSKLGRKADDAYTAADHALLEATYFAMFCDKANVKDACLMPNVYRALPLIEKLYLQSEGNDNAGTALSLLVAQLSATDLQNLEAKSAAK